MITHDSTSTHMMRGITYGISILWNTRQLVGRGNIHEPVEQSGENGGRG